MNPKNIVKASVLLGIAVMLLITPAGMSLDYPYCGDPVVEELVIAKNIYDGGSVIITNCKTKIRVEFETYDPWLLVETHVHVATSYDDLPQTNKGNAKPGQFDYPAEHDYVTSYVEEILFTDIGETGVECGETVYIAAHAVVAKEVPCEEAMIECIPPPPVCYETETGWGDGPGFEGKDWSMYIVYDIVCCAKQLTMPEKSVTYVVKGNWGTYSYFNSYVTYQTGDNELPYVIEDFGSADPFYVGWCANNRGRGPWITPNFPYTATLYDSTNPPTSNPDLDFDYWDNINYLLNHKGDYGDYSMSAVQDAIWGFTDSTYTPTSNAFYDDAVTWGDGYSPPPGGIIAVIAYIAPIAKCTTEPVQLTIIEVDP